MKEAIIKLEVTIHKKIVHQLPTYTELIGSTKTFYKIIPLKDDEEIGNVVVRQ